MPRRLNQEEIVTLKTLKQKRMSNVQIGQTLGVTEGAVRYHCRPGADSGEDGRSNKGRKADRVAEAIQHWVADYEQRHRGDRPVNVRALYDWLVSEHATKAPIALCCGTYVLIIRSRSCGRFAASRHRRVPRHRSIGRKSVAWIWARGPRRCTPW